jgi:hypothetical protein
MKSLGCWTRHVTKEISGVDAWFPRYAIEEESTKLYAASFMLQKKNTGAQRVAWSG